MIKRQPASLLPGSRPNGIDQTASRIPLRCGGVRHVAPQLGLFSRLPLVTALALAALSLNMVSASASTPAEQGERMRELLLRAQLSLDSPEEARTYAAEARAAFEADIAPAFAVAPNVRGRAIQGFDEASLALQARDAPRLAAARARVWGATLHGSYLVVHDAIRRGDGAMAQAWLPLREFTRATRVARPNTDATLAVDAFAAGGADALQVKQALDADLLNTYQSRLNTALAEARVADQKRFAIRRAETAALAAGYFQILAPKYGDQRGAAALSALGRQFDALERAAIEGRAIASLLDEVDAMLSAFRAAPLSPRDQTRRAAQLMRYLKLVPVEYGRGIRNGVVAVDLEIQEAIVFRDGARAAFDDLRPALDTRDAAVSAAVAKSFDTLGGYLRDASEHKAVVAPDVFRAQCDALVEMLAALLPPEWLKQDSSADFDVVRTALNQMERAVAAGEYALAESARIDAYAIMETGPEVKIAAFAPQHKVPIEGYFWYGHDGTPGLAKLIDARAPLVELRATRSALDAELTAAEEALGGSNSPAAAATNSGVIVFREGLEAVLILAALMASFKSATRQHLRKPMWIGALLALVASIVTWLILRQTIALFASFGEKLEAVVSLVAIGVLFLITNWFFHDVYWTGALAKSHKKKQKLINKSGEQDAVEAGAATPQPGRAGVLGGQFAGLLLLGFTSVYREGFETALFLQALTLEAGPGPVAVGALAGCALVALIGAAIFVLQARLPVMRMLVVTGIMIGAVLLIMVGKTVHTMQLVGWLPLNPIRWLPLPYWFGIWFGTYATWEGLGLQVASAVFVIGSYFLAEAAQKRRAVARRARA